MNPRNLRTSVMFEGGSYLQTFSTLTSSMCTIPSLTRTPRNSMDGCSNVHFSGLRKRLCLRSFARTQHT
jgi:hypothetical protein